MPLLRIPYIVLLTLAAGSLGLAGCDVIAPQSDRPETALEFPLPDREAARAVLP